MCAASGEFPEYEPSSPVDPRSWRILEAGVRAIGGMKALKKVKSLSITIAYSTYKDKIYFRAPNCVRRDSEFPWAKFKIAYDGKVSTRTTGTGKEIEEKKRATPAVTWLQHRIDQTLLYTIKDNAKKVKYECKSFIEDKPCNIIRMVYKDDWTCLMHFYEKTCLIGKIQYRKSGPEPQKFEKRFGNYQKVNGVRLPHFIRGENLLTGVVSESKPVYKVNPRLDGSFFLLSAR
ncbi:MAG: hypothetical protein ACYS8W_00025 [Planctomycetota bacterium]|jgi:hypothetical protein